MEPTAGYISVSVRRKTRKLNDIVLFQTFKLFKDPFLFFVCVVFSFFVSRGIPSNSFKNMGILTLWALVTLSLHATHHNCMLRPIEAPPTAAGNQDNQASAAAVQHGVQNTREGHLEGS